VKKKSKIAHNTQTIKVIGLFFFLRTGHKELGYAHAFQPYTYSLRPFSRRGVKHPSPRLFLDSDPPAFIGLMRSGG